MARSLGRFAPVRLGSRDEDGNGQPMAPVDQPGSVAMMAVVVVDPLFTRYSPSRLAARRAQRLRHTLTSVSSLARETPRREPVRVQSRAGSPLRSRGVSGMSRRMPSSTDGASGTVQGFGMNTRESSVPHAFTIPRTPSQSWDSPCLVLSPFQGPDSVPRHSANASNIPGTKRTRRPLREGALAVPPSRTSGKACVTSCNG